LERAAEIAAEFVRLNVDVIVTGGDGQVLGQDSMFHSSLIGRDLEPTPYVVCASPAYFAKAGTPETPQALQAHNCLVHITHNRLFGHHAFSRTLRFPGCSRGRRVQRTGSAAAARNAGLAPSKALWRLPAAGHQSESARSRFHRLWLQQYLQYSWPFAGRAWMTNIPSLDTRTFWGALDCSCWAF
jgi:DNA-binding transcriptional LysR family regulator